MFSFHQEISAKAISDSWMFASKFPLLIFSPTILSFSIFLYHNGPPGKLATIYPMNLARKRMEQELSVSKDAAVLKIFDFFLSHKSDSHVYWIYFKSQLGDHMSSS